MAHAFTHPVFVAAALLLVLNDHVLKGAEILPGAITGKLSDVAGLLVAPALLAWTLRVRDARGWWLTHVAVGAAFTIVQLAPSLAAALDAIAPWPARTWPDPTDLLALPALALSSRCFRPKPCAATPRALVVGLVALVACTATSRQTPAPRYPFRPGGVIDADVYLRHTGTEELAVRVLRMRDGAEVDCARLLEAPIDALGGDPFAHERRWTLARGDAVPLWDRLSDAPTRECYAVRLEAQGRAWVLAWRHDAPPVRSIEIRLEPDQPAEPEAVMIRGGQEPPRVPEGVTLRPL